MFSLLKNVAVGRGRGKVLGTNSHRISGSAVSKKPVGEKGISTVG
jgi:hypothetical protein